MKDKVFKYNFNIPFLLILVLVSLSLIFNFKELPTTLILILVSASFIYLSWAMTHHFFDKSLTVEVTLEYVLTATLALIMFVSLIFY